MTKLVILDQKLIVPNEYLQFWVHFDWFLSLLEILDVRQLCSLFELKVCKNVTFLVPHLFLCNSKYAIFSDYSGLLQILNVFILIYCRFKICNFFRLFWALIGGTWSDKNGRKPLLFLPVLGSFLQCVSYGLNYWFMMELHWRFLYLGLINSFCGSFVLYYMIEYSYLVDITTVADR